MQNGYIKLEINEIPQSLNKFVGRKNVWEYRKEKKHWRDLIYYKSLGINKKVFKKSIVKITYFFKTKARRDPDNYLKFILDGLVYSELIKDDSFNNITLILNSDYDKNNPHVLIEIYEII